VFDERGAFTWFPVYLPPPGIQLPPNGLSLAERDALLAQVMDELRPKSDGTFTISGATPGEYAITIAPASTQPAATLPKVRWTADFSPNDIKVIDEDYPVRFWPGDVQSDAVIPLSLGSGAVVSIRDLRPKKVPLYRAHISITQEDCPEGEALRVSLFRSGESGFHTEVSPCGSEVLLRNLEPGNYFLYTVSDWQGEREQIENAVWASTQFQISDENIELALVPQRGVVIEGQLVAAEGLDSIPEQLSFGVVPQEVTPGFQPGLEQFLEWLPGRQFRMVVSPRSQTFSTSGPVYIKQLRYNGSPLLDLQVPIHPGSAAHHLEMVLDDKFGTIVGSVEGGQSQMILSLSSTRTLRPQMIQVENGSFRSGPLSPGEYRVTVTTRDDIGGTLRSPQPYQQVVVRAGETTTLNLRAPGTAR